MSGERLPPWDGLNLTDLLTLERTPASARTFRNRYGDSNAHERAYGGQVLGQALLAAAHTAPPSCVATAMQFLFLQGTLHDQPIEFAVDAPQDGKRFSARHVRGVQAGARNIFDAQVSFAVPLNAPAHAAPPRPRELVEEDPESFPRIVDLPGELAQRVRETLGYLFVEKAMLDFRIPDPPPGMELELQQPRLRFWLKVKHALPDDPHLHAAAFAYLSDWWLNYASVGGHVSWLARTRQSLYIASLNHAVWLHQAFRAD